MTDYITSLRVALTQAAARQYPTEDEANARINSGPTGARVRRRWRPNWVRLWRSPPALVAVIVLGGGSTAAALALLNTNSAPLTGSVPKLAPRLRYDIPLMPDLEPGNAGWCSYPTFAITGRVDDTGAGTCSPAAPPGAPVILGGGESIANEQVFLREARHPLNLADHGLSLVWLVVSSRVAAVRIDEQEVVTSRPDPRLPAGWRAVVAFTRMPLSQIQPVPLDQRGSPLPGSRAMHVISAGALSPTESYTPGSGRPDACSIGRVHIAEVVGQWEVVATRTPALGAAVAPNTLFSCARSWFEIRGQSEPASAAYLLNAQDPKRTAPPLPGLAPTKRAGVFSNPPAQLLAKRVGVGWLVVQSRSIAAARRILAVASVRR